MNFIVHRTNSIADLDRVTDLSWGCEIDLRSDFGNSLQIRGTAVIETGKLLLSHDPWARGEDFEDWLKAFKSRGIRGTLILNTKEDGLEARCLELMKTYDISNFFFLDTALPTLVKWTKQGIRNFAVRVSHFEPLDFALKFKGLCDWAWVDCFDRIPLDLQVLLRLQTEGFKTCLVSPELQSGTKDDVSRFVYLKPNLNAICTKRPEWW